MYKRQGKRKLKTVTADHLQAFIDFLSYGGTNPDGTTSKPMSKGYMLLFSAVLQNSFRFAVFPKKLITFNPMQYVKPVSYTHLMPALVVNEKVVAMGTVLQAADVVALLHKLGF